MKFERGILCLTFDNMGAAAEIGRGMRAGPDPYSPDLITGYPKVLALLDELELKATFFIEGWNALHHPEAIRVIADHGHEIGLHGWVHEVFHSLGPLEAERILTDSQAAFRRIGIDPMGFRAPGGLRGAHTPMILKKLGIRCDCSVDEDTSNMSPRMLEGQIPNIPWQWPMIDYYQYFMHPDGARTPRQLESLWTLKLEDAAISRSLVTFIFHAFVSATDPERFATMKRLLKQAKEDQRLEILPAGQIAHRCIRGGSF